MEDKVASHQCGIRKCMIYNEDINLSEEKTHCCKLKSVSFPRGYPQQGFFDVETFEEADKQLRDFLIHFAYEAKTLNNPLQLSNSNFAALF